MVGLIAAALLGTLANPAIDELSGLAQSRADPTVLWGHNDSGGYAELFRIGLAGEDLGRVPVPGAKAGDWEGIAAFTDAGGAALLIADTGDNVRLRSYSTLYAVRDPGRGARAELLWKLDFTWPDGSHDCEAIAVDPLSREILLVTKRDEPARLYRLPLPERAPAGMQVAQFVGLLAPVPARSALRRLADWYEYAPTALDISADGLTAVLLTPRHAYVYRRHRGQAWGDLLARPSAGMDLPDLPQTEAAALSANGRVLWIGSEGRPGRWARIELP